MRINFKELHALEGNGVELYCLLSGEICKLYQSEEKDRVRIEYDDDEKYFYILTREVFNQYMLKSESDEIDRKLESGEIYSTSQPIGG